MFAVLGKILTKAWPLFLAGWIGLLVVTSLAAPPWKSVALDSEFGFLPQDKPGRLGEMLFKKAFPNDLQGSNVVLVVHREDRKLDGKDYIFIDKVLKPGLEQIADAEGGLAIQGDGQSASVAHASSASGSKQSIIGQIRTARDPGSGVLMISTDHKATLVDVELTTEFMKLRNEPLLKKIEDLLAKTRSDGKVPPGLKVDLTGSATVGRDTNRGQAQSATTTAYWTIVMVLGLLLLIYRAPVVALIPLVTIFCAVQISLKLLSILSLTGIITLFEGIQIYITIIMYGAGVDYCLFLIARYREELDGGQELPNALANAVAKTGASLTASAATVMFGIGMMTSADFGKFHFAGMAIFFSLFVAWCAVLSLAVPLLRLTGRWAFWPKGVPTHAAAKQAQPQKSAWFSWEKLAAWLVRRPGTIWLASVALMTPFAVVAVLKAREVNYDLLERLPASAPGVVGTRALVRHFSIGTTGPVTVLIDNPRIDFRTEDNQVLIKKLVDGLRAHKDELQVTDIRSLATPLGTSPVGQKTAKGPNDIVLPFPPQTIPVEPAPPLFGSGWSSSFGEGLDLGEQYHRQRIVRKKAVEHYVSSADGLAGHVTQLQLLVDANPLSRESASHLDLVESTVRKQLPQELREDSTIYLVGATADIRDLIATTGSDETRIRLLVIGCVFLILLLLLRSFTQALYLIASVLLSFFTTLGATFTFFWAFDPAAFPGLDWKVSVMLFTVLVAIGEDYNIFLMTRVREEQGQHADRVEGITQALIKTGGIITSCGLIMAGTFSSLLASALVDLKQLGFALAFGVLLDTFVVRPILVPAFLIFVAKHFHWPRPKATA